MQISCTAVQWALGGGLSNEHHMPKAMAHMPWSVHRLLQASAAQCRRRAQAVAAGAAQWRCAAPKALANPPLVGCWRTHSSPAHSAWPGSTQTAANQSSPYQASPLCAVICPTDPFISFSTRYWNCTRPLVTIMTQEVVYRK